MKNSKTFYVAQTASCFIGNYSASSQPPTLFPSDKILLRFWNKNFLKEIYRNVQTFVFKMLEECSSWASRNGAA